MENLQDDTLDVPQREHRGRPEIAPGLRQKHPIMFRLDFHRMTRLRAIARAAGTSPSLLVKAWALERMGLEAPPPIDPISPIPPA